MQQGASFIIVQLSPFIKNWPTKRCALTKFEFNVFTVMKLLHNCKTNLPTPLPAQRSLLAVVEGVEVYSL
jgi:hypothetical protein